MAFKVMNNALCNENHVGSNFLACTHLAQN